MCVQERVSGLVSVYGYGQTLICMAGVASFPGSPPHAHVYCMTFDPHEESRGEPGEFYHVSDVKGREDCT